jgi:hypothetical protein
LRDLDVKPEAKTFPSIVESLFMFRDHTSSLQVRQHQAANALARELLNYDEENLSLASRATQVMFIQLLRDCQQRKKVAGY